MEQNLPTHGAEQSQGYPQTSLQADPAGTSTCEQPSPRVLVVDDNMVNTKVAVFMLAKLGVSADTAANGLEALAAIQRFPYVFVLMDGCMPEMDGLEATREQRQREAGRYHLPIIAMTASTGDDISSCLAAGMDGSLAKPVRREDLERVLSAWGGGVGMDALRRIAQTVDNDPQILAAVIEEFSQSGGAMLVSMRSAVAAGDAGALGSTAHALKGAALNFGARHLADLCARLGSMAAAGQALESGVFAEAVVQEFGRACRALQSASSNL